MRELISVSGFRGLPQRIDAGPAAEPPARPGPAYVVRYDLGVPWAPEMVLYPDSSAGPLVYTPPGQQPYDVAVRGGWATARVDLARFLRGYGFTVPNENRRPVWWPAAGLVVLLELARLGQLISTKVDLPPS